MADQDFFFDEETEQKPSKTAKSADTSNAKAAGKPAAKTAGARPGQGQSVFAQNVTLAVASLMAVCALLVGVIVGLIIPRSGSIETGFGQQPAQTAPTLSPEQIGSGELPPGHPNIAGAAGATGTPGGSTSATPTK